MLGHLIEMNCALVQQLRADVPGNYDRGCFKSDAFAIMPKSYNVVLCFIRFLIVYAAICGEIASCIHFDADCVTI